MNIVPIGLDTITLNKINTKLETHFHCGCPNCSSLPGPVEGVILNKICI